MIKDKILYSTYGASLVLIVLSASMALIGLPYSQGDIIIRFDNYHNEIVWSGGVGVFFGVIGTVILVTLLNGWLSVHIYDKDKFLSQILGTGTLVINILFLIAVFSVGLIN